MSHPKKASIFSHVRVVAVPLLFAIGNCAPDIETSLNEVHTVCAMQTSVRGVDVSVYQGMIDWAAAARGGIRFAMIRQSHGTTADNTFMRNWTGTRANGILRGAYQYFDPQGDAARQANIICDALIAAGFGPGDLPPMIDVEEPAPMGGSLPAPATYATKVRTWLNIVHTRLGVDGIIYTGGYYWDANLRTSEFASNPYWHAEYPNYPNTIYQVGVNPLPRMACPQAISNAWNRWSFWQFAGNNGRAPGFSGAVDCDVFNGTLDQLRVLARVPGAGDAGVITDSGVVTDTGVRTDSGVRTDGNGGRNDVPDPVEMDVPDDVPTPNAPDAAATDVRTSTDNGGRDSGMNGNMNGGCGCRVDSPANSPTNLPLIATFTAALAGLTTRSRRRSRRTPRRTNTQST